MSNINPEVRKFFSDLGKKAGETNRAKGPEYFRELQKKSVLARKRKKLSTDDNVAG